VLGTVGSLAAAGLLAGCTTETDSGDGGDDSGDTGTPTEDTGGGSPSYDQAAAEEYLPGVGNYDGTVVDERGSSSVTVAVGTAGNGGNYAFSPPAVVVDAGTTIQFEWTGKGQRHNVVHEGGDYESERYSGAGVTFERTFDSTGVSRYFCTPHKRLGMKDIVAVV